MTNDDIRAEALATIAERDRRIAELTTQLDLAIKTATSYGTKFDTATHELAEAKKSLKRWDSEMAKLQTTRAKELTELADAKAEIAGLRESMGNGDWADLQSLVDGKVKAIMERNQLKAENDKLRATVAAKNEAFQKIVSTPAYTPLGEAIRSTAKRALSPEIANKFVRREGTIL